MVKAASSEELSNAFQEHLEAQAAITALNGQDSGGRSLTVNEARPRTEGGKGGPGGRGGQSGRYGGRRY